MSGLRALLVIAACAALAACALGANNRCGNEQRDWGGLSFPKGNYCSVPRWVPLRKQYERANKSVCKVHDNNSGINSTMSQREADYRFLCDYMKRSELPWGVKHVTAITSFAIVRTRSVLSADH